MDLATKLTDTSEFKQIKSIAFPRKTSENLMFFWCYQVKENRNNLLKFT